MSCDQITNFQPDNEQIYSTGGCRLNIIQNTKLWLIVIALGHTVLGAGGAYATYGNDELCDHWVFSVVGVYLFYAAFMTEGQTQSRLAAVLVHRSFGSFYAPH